MHKHYKHELTLILTSLAALLNIFFRQIAWHDKILAFLADFEQTLRLPCWRTNSSNIGSWKVARQLGLKETPGSEEYLFISNYQHVGAYATVAP